MRELKTTTIVIRSLQHHWRKNLSVALGVMAASAVLIGALLVGDSMRRSLTDLTLARLGDIDEILITPRFFRDSLGPDLAKARGFDEYYGGAESTVIFPLGTVETGPIDGRRRAGSVLVIGSSEPFWNLGSPEAKPAKLPGKDEVLVNQALADDLNASVGDLVTVRLPNTEVQVNADNPLGNKDDRIDSITRLKIAEIIPNTGLGRFSLFPSQAISRNIYVHLETLRDRLNQDGKANAILVAGKQRESAAPIEGSDLLAASLTPDFADYGLKLKRVTLKQEDSDQPVLDYFSLSTDQMVLDDDVARIATEAFKSKGGQPAYTYLANSIFKPDADGKEPSDPKQKAVYSLITAIESTAELGPILADDGSPVVLMDDEIALNSWMAERINAKVGDTVSIAYFEPETTHGEEVELSTTFRVAAIVPITQPQRKIQRNRPPKYRQRPTLANDPDLTPEVKGVTDEESMDDWETPFRRTREIDTKKGGDEDYWDYYRTTPKAFVNLAAGQKLWGSRFGSLTSIRIPFADGLTVESLEEDFMKQMRADGAKLGFHFAPVKRNGLAASSGATPFDGLFLALSFFIIVSALLLVSLLFRLGMEQRTDEMGIMLAMGLRRKAVGRILVCEGALVSAIGAAIGIAVGIGYAKLMILGLNTWWIGAVVEQFLVFHWTTTSLVIGYFSGVIVCTLTIMWSVRQTKLQTVIELMNKHQRARADYAQAASSRWVMITVVASVILAISLAGLAATQLSGMAQAGAFMGGGALLLIGILVFVWDRLRRSSDQDVRIGAMTLPRLAMSSAQRNPSRSTLTVALMSFASFLIVSMSSFRLAPSDEGMGGFDQIAISSQPIYENLNDEEVIRELFTEEEVELLSAGKVLAMRMKSGEDASCNNLYQTNQPRILGATQELVDYYDQSGSQPFRFQASAASRGTAAQANPWHLLQTTGDPHAGTQDDPIPVVVDQNTAMYGLKKFTSVGSVDSILFDDGRRVHFTVVGLLSNSTLQGSLVIGEADFRKAFASVSGYRYFLVKTPASDQASYIEKLESKFGDQGFDATSSTALLEQLLAVQNTYLSTFQSLGALGLLLGTLGLATVQLRSVLERRAELALMRASGFARFQLGKMVLFENATLLFGGTLAGVGAALVAVLPHMIFGNASVPFAELTVMMVVILGVGCISSSFAVLTTTRAPILEALRGD